MAGTRRRSSAERGDTRIAWTAAFLMLTGCALFRQPGLGPQSRPSAEKGILVYSVGRLSIQVPEQWDAYGDPKKVKLVSPRKNARIDARVTDRLFANDRDCLSQAEDALVRGSTNLSNVRRHSTTFAGRKAVTQEADDRGWHGWAWAVCDGGEQYRVFFTGHSPLDDEALRVSRQLPGGALLAPKSDM